MKELVPYVNMETVKDAHGKIQRFIVRTVTNLPEDCKITTSGEGKIADNVYHRPLTISYSEMTDDFDAVNHEFVIERQDIGLLERGVRVRVVKNGLQEKVVARTMEACSTSSEGEGGGVSIEYEEIDV